MGSVSQIRKFSDSLPYEKFLQILKFCTFRVGKTFCSIKIKEFWPFEKVAIFLGNFSGEKKFANGPKK